MDLLRFLLPRSRGNASSIPWGFDDKALTELTGPDEDGDFVRPASLFITPIWYRFDHTEKSWFWTPERDKSIWMSVSRLTVSSGYWQGETPAPANVAIINRLQAIQPRPMIRYNIDSMVHIGAGGFGDVYRCAVSNPGNVALARRFRACNPDFCAVKNVEIRHTVDIDPAIQRELQMLERVAQCMHSNIVLFWGAHVRHREDRQFSTISIVMELCDGSLRSVIDRLTEPLATDIASRLVLDVLAALEFLHSMSICHSDLKPDNILYAKDASGERYTFKLSDFGSARNLYTAKEATSSILGGGTMGYCSPECLVDGQKHTTSRDIWALGITLYECSSPGRKPFTDLQPFLACIYEPLSLEVSDAVRGVVTSCLRPNPRPSAQLLRESFLAQNVE